MQRVCNNCKIPKELNFNNFYYENKNINSFKGSCKECHKLKSNENYYNNHEVRKQNQKIYQQDNIEKILEYQKEYYNNNLAIIKEKNQKWYVLNKDKISKEQKQKLNSIEGDNIRFKQNQYRKQRKENDKLFKLTVNLRSQVSKIFTKTGYKKQETTKKLIGESFDFVKNYLEQKFLKEMNWDNWGDIWEIDHIIPTSKAKNKEDLIYLFHYTNLQPLFKTTEIAKSFGYHNYIGNRDKHNNIFNIIQNAKP